MVALGVQLALCGNSCRAIDSALGLLAFGQGAQQAGFDRAPCQMAPAPFSGSSGSGGNSEQAHPPQRRMYGRSAPTSAASLVPLRMLTIPRNKESGATPPPPDLSCCLLLSYTFPLHFFEHIAVPIDLIFHSDDDKACKTAHEEEQACLSMSVCCEQECR